jgi:hypothetical protein
MVDALLVIFVIADFLFVEMMLGNQLRFEKGWAAVRIVTLMAMEVCIWALFSDARAGRAVGVVVGEILIIIGAVICSYIKTWNTAKTMQEQNRPVPANYKAYIITSAILLGISFIFDIVGIIQIIAYVVYGWLLLSMRQAGAPLVINRIFFSIVGQIILGILFSILIGLILVGAINSTSGTDAQNAVTAAVFFSDLYYLASKLFTLTSMGYTLWDICCAPPKEILNVNVDGTNFYALGDEPLPANTTNGGDPGRASDLPTSYGPPAEVRDSEATKP